MKFIRWHNHMLMNVYPDSYYTLMLFTYLFAEHCYERM